jgi:hypothetical protein
VAGGAGRREGKTGVETVSKFGKKSLPLSDTSATSRNDWLCTIQTDFQLFLGLFETKDVAHTRVIPFWQNAIMRYWFNMISIDGLSVSDQEIATRWTVSTARSDDCLNAWDSTQWDSSLFCNYSFETTCKGAARPPTHTSKTAQRNFIDPKVYSPSSTDSKSRQMALRRIVARCAAAKTTQRRCVAQVRTSPHTKTFSFDFTPRSIFEATLWFFDSQLHLDIFVSNIRCPILSCSV